METGVPEEASGANESEALSSGESRMNILASSKTIGEGFAYFRWHWLRFGAVDYTEHEATHSHCRKCWKRKEWL